jgi:hypothetical protein
VRDRWLVGRVPGDVAAPSPSPPCHWQRWVEGGVSRRALDHIVTSTGTEARDEDIERLSPLGSDHITLTGRYRVLLQAPTTRPQRVPRPQHPRGRRSSLTRFSERNFSAPRLHGRLHLPNHRGRSRPHPSAHSRETCPTHQDPPSTPVSATTEWSGAPVPSDASYGQKRKLSLSDPGVVVASAVQAGWMLFTKRLVRGPRIRPGLGVSPSVRPAQ